MAYSAEQLQQHRRIASKPVVERLLQEQLAGPYVKELQMLKPYAHIQEVKGSSTGHPNLNQIRVYKDAPETIGFQIRYTGPTNEWRDGVDHELFASVSINLEEWEVIDRYVRTQLAK